MAPLSVPDHNPNLLRKKFKSTFFCRASFTRWHLKNYLCQLWWLHKIKILHFQQQKDNQHNDNKVIENKYLLNLKSRRECLKKSLQRGIISCLKKTKLTKIGSRYEVGTANTAFTSFTTFNANTASTSYSLPNRYPNQTRWYLYWYPTWPDSV